MTGDWIRISYDTNIGSVKYTYFYRVKKLDRLKRQRYDISMKIIDLESRISSLTKKELKTFDFLKKKEKELNNKIDNF